MKTKLEELLKQASLESRLKVSNQMAFINLIVALGYREDKMWTDEEDELLQKLIELAKKHTDEQLKQIIQWEKDGRPL